MSSSSLVDQPHAIRHADMLRPGTKQFADTPVLATLSARPREGPSSAVVFLIPTAVMMHAFWRESEAQARQLEQIQFLKDISLAGAALMLFALFAHLGDDLGLVIVGPLFNF